MPLTGEETDLLEALGVHLTEQADTSLKELARRPLPTIEQGGSTYVDVNRNEYIVLLSVAEHARELLDIFLEGGYAEDGDGPLLDALSAALSQL